jgi:hypothetical protein
MTTRRARVGEKRDGAYYRRPLFPISVIAGLLQVTQTTLRLWEKKGLIRPRRLGKNRFYSYADYDRLREIAYLLRKKGMNIAGVRDWLKSRCWEIKQCGSRRYRCPVFETRAPKISYPAADLPALNPER